MTGGLPGSLPRSSGISALVNLDGAPLDPAELRALGMAGEAGANWAIDALDHHFPGAADRHVDEHGVTVIVGHVAECAALAARLGLRADAPSALVAATALKRFGGDTPREMIGEWSLAHLADGRALTLMLAATHRDRLLYASAGARVAAASNLFALAELDWIDSRIDETGFLCRLGGAQVRRGRGDSSMLRGVRQLAPGSSVTIGASGVVRTSQASALTEQPRWQGSFPDAVEASEVLLRGIIRERLALNPNAGALLSGGLDSSLLTWLAAEERDAARPLPAVTSAAPPGSGLPDETGFAAMVADRLSIRLERSWPQDSANAYRPTHAILTSASGPPLPNRHCLAEAFQITAARSGVSFLIDGMFGEATVSAWLPDLRLRTAMRSRAARLYRAMRQRRPANDPLDAFHVRLAPARLGRLPEAIEAALRLSPLDDPPPRRDGLFGYSLLSGKCLEQPSEFYPGAVRNIQPYRDIRLLRLFAGFPVEMLLAGGRDRPVARRMLRGHLPDAIRLRRLGMPASPDHLTRLQRQANEARARILAFRKAEVDEWLDLDWLDDRLGRVAEHGPIDVNEANTVQLTAIVAEFLTWWRSRG